MLHIYNTLSQSKEPFTPIREGHVGLYVCGMTVYDYCHIGHARVFVTFDMVVRYLRYLDYDVQYVRNITDIDDKIIARAAENQQEITQLTRHFIDCMHEDEAKLGVLRPDEEPKATEHIDEMLAMIETLIEKGAAYPTPQGDVYFSVKACSHYGELTQQDVNQLRAGARVDVIDAKRDPLDFVLWKMAKPGEPSWPSPWGDGRPGWHIECSAMSSHYLGKQFDLHGGGVDLRFPHHQNEVAQSDMAHDCQSVKGWMHVGHVQVNQEKMSKSLGNFFTIREVMQDYSPEVIRYFMLASHYRSPVSYGVDHLNSAKKALTRCYLALRGLEITEPDALLDSEYANRFHAAMCDDFNTPEAWAVLFDLVRHINKLRQEQHPEVGAYAGLLRHLAGTMGFLQQDAEAFLQDDLDEALPENILAMIEAREQARQQRDWAQADQIRDELLAAGMVLEDSSTGTRWRRQVKHD